MAKNTNYFIKFDLIILSILERKDHYAYDITKIIKKITNNRIEPKQGTIYPFIYKMLDDKLITSYTKPVGNKLRVYYHIEHAGREYLKAGLKEFYTLYEAIDVIFKGEYED